MFLKNNRFFLRELLTTITAENYLSTTIRIRSFATITSITATVTRSTTPIKTIESLKNIIIRKMSKIQNEENQQNKRKPLAAICHMRSTNDKKDNLKQVCEIVERARNQSANFLFIPECCDFVGENRKQTLELCEPLNGSTVKAYKELAKNNQMWISFGGIHEAILNDNGQKTDKIYNTNLVINECGEIVSIYRKLHLFDVDTPEFRFRESDIVQNGSEIVNPFDTPIGKLGLQICYDIRFPEVSTILRKHGAEILTYPSAFAYSTGKVHWEILLRARAIENQCYVIAPAQIGFHNDKRQSYGHGMIVDPWGKILVECKNEDLDVAVAEIDLKYLNGIRQNMPCFNHRRNDAYALVPVNITDRCNNCDMKFGNNIIPGGTIFFTSKNCFAFTNISCVVPGHVLVATKRPAKRLKDLNGEEVADLFQTVSTVQRFLEKYYNATSTTVTVQDGEDAGQTVAHVHFHIMPRRKGDFTFNDQIYIELNKHDHDMDRKRRPVNEMIDEAETYRKFIKQLTEMVYT